MKHSGWGLAAAGLLCVAAVAAAAEPPVPRIDHTFPPPVDVRRADRTIAGAHAGPVQLLGYARDGRTVASAGRDGVVKLWNARPGNAAEGQLIRTLELGAKRPADAVRALGFGPADKALVVVTGRSEASSWDPASGTRTATVTLRPAPGRGAETVVSPGADLVVAGLAGKQVALWNVATGERGRSFEPADAGVRRLAFSPDGKTLAAGSQGGTIYLWETDSGRLLRRMETRSPVRALALSATHLAAGSAGGAVLVWPLPGEFPPRTLAGHPVPVSVLAFSPKGGEIASAGPDRDIQVWDVATGQRLCTQHGHRGGVLALAFSPNGQKMGSGAADGSLRSWTVPLPPIASADLGKLTAAVPQRATATPRRPRKLLVFWRADAILHKAGVPAANKAIELAGRTTGAFEAHFSRDYEVFDAKLLAGYDAVVLNSTAHIVMPDEGKKQALLDYVRGGGGVVGIHAAIDMWKQWPEGAKVVGATFAGHPWGPGGSWSVKLEEPQHPLLRAFGGKGFKLQDEFYELGEPYSRLDRRVLLSLDLTDAATASVKPLHRSDRDFAVSWLKRFGEGRVFYAMFGHRAEPFHDPAIARFYLDGIQYVLGDLDVPDAPGAAAASNSNQQR